MTRLIAVIFAAVLLSGCATVGPWIGQTVEQAKAAKDLEAGVLLAGQCAAGRGAINRMFKNDPDKLAALDLLCDGPDPGRQAPRLDAATIEAFRVIFGVRQPAPMAAPLPAPGGS